MFTKTAAVEKACFLRRIARAANQRRGNGRSRQTALLRPHDGFEEKTGRQGDPRSVKPELDGGVAAHGGATAQKSQRTVRKKYIFPKFKPHGAGHVDRVDPRRVQARGYFGEVNRQSGLKDQQDDRYPERGIGRRSSLDCFPLPHRLPGEIAPTAFAPRANRWASFSCRPLRTRPRRRCAPGCSRRSTSPARTADPTPTACPRGPHPCPTC